MPFDQIYWNHYGAGDFADSGYTDIGTSGDVRFGVTSTADSHSTFSFYGKRRKRFASFWNLLYRDTKFPYNSNNFGAYGTGGFWTTDWDVGSPEPALPNPSAGSTQNACSKSDGWTDSGYNGVCKPRREWQVQVGETVVYSWPGLEDYTYSNFNVNDMKKTGNGGNNIENIYNTPTDEHLFQSQNRESCHNISNTARVKDATNTFIGIHKDYPLTVTTSKSMRGYYLILKRKRFVYNEYASKHTKQYGTSSSVHYQRGGAIKWVHIDSRQGNYLKLKDLTTFTNAESKKTPWTDEFATIKQNFNSDDVGRTIIALKNNSTIGLVKDTVYEITEFTSLTSVKINASSGNKTLTYSDVRDKWDWIDSQGRITPGHGEIEITDNITGVLSSPLGAPLSQTRDYLSMWDTWYGYNWRAAGEGPQTEEEDLKGLFRSKVPWKNLLVLPLDNLDEDINTWFVNWNIVIFNKLLQQIVIDNNVPIVNNLTAIYNADKADTDAKYIDYTDALAVAQQEDAAWEALKVITLAKEAVLQDESDTKDALQADYDDTLAADNDALDIYNQWVTYYNGTIANLQPWIDHCFYYSTNFPDTWDEATSFAYRCGETYPGPAGTEATYGWAANNYASYVYYLGDYNYAKSSMDAALAQRNLTKAAKDADLAELNAQIAIYNAAVVDAQAAADAQDAQNVVLQAALTEEARVKGIWQTAKAKSDLSGTAMNEAIAEAEVAQDLMDIYTAEEAAYPNNAGTAMRDRIQNPIYYGDTRLNWREPQYATAANGFNSQLDRSNPTGSDHDGSADLIDAVIHPTFVPRERAETGSVYIKNITIEKNGTVLKAKDDSVGEFIDVPSSEIYTDRSTSIKVSGTKDQKWLTFSNLYYNKTNIIHRYISTDFKIRIPEAGLYEIDEVESSGNRIKLKTNLSMNVSNKDFTLKIPRGSTNPDYTWGQLELTEFDNDTYETSSTVDMNQQHKVPKSGGGIQTIATSGVQGIDPNNEYDASYDNHFLHVLSDSMSLFLRDLFRSTSADKAHQTLGQLYNSASFGMTAGHLGKAVRHPLFSNELSESLHIRNDFFSWAYYEYLYFGAPAGQGGHVSSKVQGNVTWNKYKWVNYWERTRTSVLMQTEALSEFADSGFTNLNESEFDGFVTYTDLDGNETQTKAKQFFYGGIDKASSAIWPCYENNIASLSPDNFNQNFTSNYSSWVDEFTEAYTNHNHSLRGINLGASVHNTPSVQKILDRPWFSYCAFSQNPGLITNITNSQGRTTQRAVMQLAMTHRNFNDADNAKRALPWTTMQNAKYEKILKRPSVLAQYGYAGDMFGYSTADVGFANNDWADHHITIYESNNVLPAGTTFNVSIHQAGTEFNDDIRNEKEIRVVDDNYVGDGRSKIALDNYTLYVVAK